MRWLCRPTRFVQGILGARSGGSPVSHDLRKIFAFTFSGSPVFILVLNMHLMYTLDENGNRLYTLKVGFFICAAYHQLTDLIESIGRRKDYEVRTSWYA